MPIHIVGPEAGKDYPGNWNDFLDWFASEEACLAYLEQLRWPQGFVCPNCGAAGDPYRSSRSRLMCRGCSHQSTVTAGTIFDKTRTPLRVWLAAAWYVTNQKQGVSALGLQRVLGLGSYSTAWTMLHRLRRAMIQPDRERLKGVVEVDETYLAITDRAEPRSETTPDTQEQDAPSACRHCGRVGPAQGLRAHPAAPYRQRFARTGPSVRARLG
jgi:transposase-like protein